MSIVRALILLEIKETSTDVTQPDYDSPVLSSINKPEQPNPKQTQIDQMKARCRQTLGDEMFEKVKFSIILVILKGIYLP